MTDNEIIKALERMSAEDADGFSSDILDLIKRQQAKIEELKSNNRVTQRLLSEAWEDCDYFEDKVKTIKSETITEFAERLKATIAGLEVKSPNVIYKGGMEEALYYRMPTIIELLVKEMAEGNNGA